MIAIAVFLALVGCGAALPARPSSDPAETVVGVPVLIEDPTRLNPAAESSPLVYGLLLSRLTMPEDTVNSGLIAKRSVAAVEDQDDLETAAGTYALRPLFVYRQQLAYRERVREANRRGYRF
ncbi:uncharacterized protein LOC144471946 [Augochlora pura]